jgi:hypothetical protein
MLNLVIKVDGLGDNGPKPMGPITPTAKMYDSHASKPVTLAFKDFVVCLGSANFKQNIHKKGNVAK